VLRARESVWRSASCEPEPVARRRRSAWSRPSPSRDAIPRGAFGAAEALTPRSSSTSVSGGPRQLDPGSNMSSFISFPRMRHSLEEITKDLVSIESIGKHDDPGPPGAHVVRRCKADPGAKFPRQSAGSSWVTATAISSYYVIQGNPTGRICPRFMVGRFVAESRASRSGATVRTTRKPLL
jgi:hypothetical protein